MSLHTSFLSRNAALWADQQTVDAHSGEPHELRLKYLRYHAITLVLRLFQPTGCGDDLNYLLDHILHTTKKKTMVQATIQPSSTTSSITFIFVICLLFRLLNAFYTRTYDNPDEYWQGQEVAHELVFGNGYLTWEWREKIRSFAHPLAIAMVYKLIQVVGLDSTHVLVAAPRYFQATLAAVADVATYTLAKKVIGNDIALSMVWLIFAHVVCRSHTETFIWIAFHNIVFLVQFSDGSKNAVEQYGDGVHHYCIELLAITGYCQDNRKVLGQTLSHLTCICLDCLCDETHQWTDLAVFRYPATAMLQQSIQGGQQCHAYLRLGRSIRCGGRHTALQPRLDRFHATSCIHTLLVLQDQRSQQRISAVRCSYMALVCVSGHPIHLYNIFTTDWIWTLSNLYHAHVQSHQIIALLVHVGCYDIQFIATQRISLHIPHRTFDSDDCSVWLTTSRVESMAQTHHALLGSHSNTHGTVHVHLASTRRHGCHAMDSISARQHHDCWCPHALPFHALVLCCS